jgi:hypothetical protein
MSISGMTLPRMRNGINSTCPVKTATAEMEKAWVSESTMYLESNEYIIVHCIPSTESASFPSPYSSREALSGIAESG